jgi:flagellar hook-associated protein 3 FlgL
MRVSNDTLRSAFLSALDDARRRVLDTQQKVSTGLRVNSPSDDPVAAARVAHLDSSLARIEQFGANAIFARNQLGLEEEALNDVIGNLQRIRELVLQANNSTASDGDRRIIAAEIRQHRDALLALANTTDVDGRHLFGGYREAVVPFTADANGNVVYGGDQGQPVRRGQRPRRRRVRADSRGQRDFRPRRERGQHGHRNTRPRRGGQPGRMGVRHLYHSILDPDELRGAQ